MASFDAPWLLSLAAALVVAGLQVMMPKRWGKRIGRLLIVFAALFAGFGVYGLLSQPRVVVKVAEKYRRELGEPLPVEKLAYEWVYQGLYEGGFVIWIDGRFFLMGLDHEYWHSFADAFPTNDPQWFAEAPLRKYFPKCGDRLPIGGLAKAMLGPQKQYYEWLGCLQSANGSSLTRNVVLQRFANGYVIEGPLDPPQSAVRKRFILVNGSRWESEHIDSNGKWIPNTLH